VAQIAYEKIMVGLEDALAYSKGDRSRGTAHQVKIADVDITHLRKERAKKLAEALHCDYRQLL
jgi:hypothetical protein